MVRFRRLNTKVLKALRRREKGASPRDVLWRMFSVEGMTLAEVACALGVTRPAVTYQVRAMGLPIASRGRPLSLTERVKRAGYSSVYEYFAQNGRKSFKGMAAELGTTWCTVQRWYDIFLRGLGSVREGA